MSSGAGASSAQLPLLRNRTFDEISVGDSESIERTLTSNDLQLYAVISGDHSPQQPAGEGRAAKEAGGDFQGVIAHGMWAGALISAVIGTRLPGPGTTYLGQSLRFRAPVRVGDTLTIRVTVTDRDAASRQLRLACSGVKQDGTAVIDGEAEVVAPHEHLEFHRVALPEVRLSAGIGGLQRLLEHVRPLGSIRVAVVHPCDAWSGHRAQRHRPRPGDRRREPRVAILAGMEELTVSTAALCKMADRGQISGGILDGPLAFDNAVSMAAARPVRASSSARRCRSS